MKYSLTELLLNEYSDKLINRMYDIYKTQTEDNEDQIKQNIKDYDRFKDAVGSKLQQNNPAVLRAVPQDLQQNNRFKDITLIKDYNTLVRILKATAKKETDIYKQAIEYFTKKNPYMDPTVIGSYVARFKQNKNNIDNAVKEKNTDITSLIPNEILNKEEASNILAYKSFEDIEKLLDGAFPTASKEKTKANSAEVDADKIYDNPSNGISIYLGDAKHKCIKYGRNQYYDWCISRVGGGNMYGGYRFRLKEGENKMFYFVIDSTATDEKKPNSNYFINPYHAVVINVREDGLYLRSTADNRGDEPYGGTEWNNLGQYFYGEDGQRLWNKIKGLKEYFVFIPPTAEERREEGFKNQPLTLDQFIDLDQEDKRAWLNVNATNRNLVTPEIVASLDNKEINDLINNNRIFSFKELQKSQGLIKRYADYQYTRNPKNPLPYQFIPYLKPELQKKYYNDFNESHITFEILDRFFNKDIVKDYVDKELKAFNYLPEEAKKYMDNEQKQLFDLYSIAFKDIINYNTPVDETSTAAPEQQTSLPAISKKTFMSLSPKDRKDFMDFYLKLGSDVSNVNKNLVFFIGTPTTFEVNNKLFMLVPDTPNSETYELIDTNGDVLIDGIKGWEVLKDGKPLPNDVNLWRPLGSKSFLIKSEDFDEIEVMRNDKKEKYTKNDFIKQLDEVYLNNYYRNQIKYRAGIIK